MAIKISSTNLKDGNGELCAGQTRVTAFSSCLVIPFELISSENFGFALPIGSEQLKIDKPNLKFFLWMLLNAGMGFSTTEQSSTLKSIHFGLSYPVSRNSYFSFWIKSHAQCSDFTNL